MSWLPFQPKIVNRVAKAYNDSSARTANRATGGRIQEVSSRKVGSKTASLLEVERFQQGMVVS